MKWFKHETSALKDEKIQEIIESDGLIAYAIFFSVLELCGEKINDENLKADISISWWYVERLLRVKRSTVHRVLDTCQSVGLLVHNSTPDMMICSVPKLLKRLDNWTKRSVVATEKLPLEEKKKEKENKKEKRSIEPTANSSDFLNSLKANPAYKDIDLERELLKMDAWLSLPKNKHRQKTPRFILNWINKIEKPIPIQEDMTDVLKKRQQEKENAKFYV